MRSDFFDKLRNLSFLYESGKIRYDKKVSEERAVLKEDFGQNVRYYRKEKKSTLEAAAELCDITSDKITRFSFERGPVKIYAQIYLQAPAE